MDRIQKIIFISLFEFYNRLANINKTAVIYDELNDNIGSNNNCNIHCKLDGWNGCYDAWLLYAYYYKWNNTLYYFINIYSVFQYNNCLVELYNKYNRP